MTPYAFTVDHLAYVTSRKHRREVHAAFRRIAGRKAGVFACRVLHETHDDCCAVEPWPVTAGRIADALELDGSPALWAVLRAKGCGMKEEAR